MWCLSFSRLGCAPKPCWGAKVLTLTAAEIALLDRARAFAERVVKPQIEAKQGSASSSMGWMPEAGQAGLLAVQVPQALGGGGLSFACKVQLTQILAEADFGVAMAVVNSQNVAERLAQMDDLSLAQGIAPGLMAGTTTACTALTEPDAGSDFAAIQTRAQQVAGGWVLTGSKTWITNAHHADWVVVYAQTQAVAGAAGVAAFLVDANAPGFHKPVTVCWCKGVVVWPCLPCSLPSCWGHMSRSSPPAKSAWRGPRPWGQMQSSTTARPPNGPRPPAS
ncbi:MAG: hypothetical protein C4K60_11205 [Ideonella sp. MAG2]|nr:MAG: hypothetical protein C4K60_11205 [Ideonella sp. MAG2]